jgi:hypothetical protein
MKYWYIARIHILAEHGDNHDISEYESIVQMVEYSLHDST